MLAGEEMPGRRRSGSARSSRRRSTAGVPRRTLLDDADLETPAGRDRGARRGGAGAGGDGRTRSRRDELVREVAERLGADPALVTRRLAATPGEAGEARAAPAAAQGAGDGRRRRAGGGRRARPLELSARERRERALLAMCIASPAEGREYAGAAERRASSRRPRCGRATGCAGISRTRSAGLAARGRGAGLADRQRRGGDCRPRSRAERAPRRWRSTSWSSSYAMLERQIAARSRDGGDAPVDLQRQPSGLAENASPASGGAC